MGYYDYKRFLTRLLSGLGEFTSARTTFRSRSESRYWRHNWRSRYPRRVHQKRMQSLSKYSSLHCTEHGEFSQTTSQEIPNRVSQTAYKRQRSFVFSK